MQRPIVVLPLPDSPTRATHRPGLDAERDAADRGVAGAARPVLDLEARDLEERRRRRRPGWPPGRPPVRPPTSSSSLQRTHRTAWSGTAISSSGTAARQRSSSNRHRGANAQPAGHSPTPTATPGMPWSARGRRKSGIAPTSARVYGCRGLPITSSTGPFSTTRPAYMTTIRSAMRATTARSCVTYTIAIPSSLRSRASSVRMRSWVRTSSPVVGSSSTATGGPQTHAIAIVTRCCCPPDSWCG